MCIGALLHSISSDDVTTVRSQLAIDKRSRDVSGLRDSGIHHRRRRDRAIFEPDRPEKDAEKSRRAQRYSVPNNFSKQEPTNQNGKAITDHAHDRHVTSHGAEPRKCLDSVAEKRISTQDDATKSEVGKNLPTDAEGSGDKIKSNSFASFLRRMTQFRRSSSKHDSTVKLMNYTITDDVEHRATVRRHQSLTTFDVAEASRQTATASRHRDIFAESNRRPSLQNDAASTSRNRELVRHSSDRTLAKSRLNRVVMSQEPDGDASVQRHNSMTSGARSHDILAEKSTPILKLAGPSPTKRSDKFVHHKSQIITTKPEFGRGSYRPQPTATKSRNDTFRALPCNDLVRHESLLTITTSRNDSVVSPKRHDLLPRRDVATASPVSNLSRDSQAMKTKSRPQEVGSRRHELQPRNDVVTSRSHQSRHGNVMTSRRHNSVNPTTSPSNIRTDNIGPEDSRETITATSTESEHSSTSRTATHDYDVTKSSNLGQSSLAKRGQTSVQLTPASAAQQNVIEIPPPSPQPSSTSSKSRDQDAGKPAMTPEPHVLASSESIQTASDSNGPVPTPRQDPGQISSSSSLRSSSESQDQDTSMPATITESPEMPSPERTQTSPESTRPIPSPRQKTSEVPPSSPVQSSPASSPPSLKSEAQVTSESATVAELHTTPSTSPRSDAIKPIPTPRQKISPASPSSSLQLPSSTSSKSSDSVQSEPASTTESYVLPPAGGNRTGFESTRPVPMPRKNAGKIRSPSPPQLASSLPRSHDDVVTVSRSVSTVSRSTTSEGRQTKPADSVDSDTSSSIQQNTSQTLSTQTSLSTSSSASDRIRDHSTTTIIIPQDTPPTTTDMRYSIPVYQEAHADGPDELMDELSESGSRRETTNVVIVRPLPAFGQVTYGINDDETKCRSRRQTVCLSPSATVTGSEDEDDNDMRSRRSFVSGVSRASGMKSALRKNSRSQSCDRHVSYSSTDTVYRSAWHACIGLRFS